MAEFCQLLGLEGLVAMVFAIVSGYIWLIKQYVDVTKARAADADRRAEERLQENQQWRELVLARSGK